MRINDFEIEFELSQTTPLIHFNAKRLDGADIIDNKNETYLRVTELKPKFDKFLMAYCKTYNKKYKNLVKDNAFDYFVEVYVNDFKVQKIKRNPLFFANLKPRHISDTEWEEKQKRIVDLKGIKVKFFSFYKEMIDLIEESFESFLASTNFGTRSSKGFGGFYIKDKSFDKDKVFYIHKGKLKKAKVFSFSTYPLKDGKYHNWEDYLNLFYKFLRSGINLKDKNEKTIFYTKPVIFEYFKDKYEWEKRAVKSKCLKYELEKQIKKYPNSDILLNTKKEKRIIKDVFGLSTIESWRKYSKTLKKESVEKVNNKPKYKRFQSPITFKYFNGNIYFWANETFREMLGKEFFINLSGCKMKLKIVENFNFDEFFDFLKNLNLKTFILAKYHNTPEFRILEKIHNQLKVIK